MIGATVHGDTAKPSKESASNNCKLTGKENSLLFPLPSCLRTWRTARRDRCGSGLICSENHFHCCLEYTDGLLRLFFSHLDYSLKQEFCYSLQNYLSQLLLVLRTFQILTYFSNCFVMTPRLLPVFLARCVKVETRCLGNNSLFSFSESYRFWLPSLGYLICMIDYPGVSLYVWENTSSWGAAWTWSQGLETLRQLSG